MLLKLEMKFAEPSGDPIKTCTILKCHKQVGDRVDCGDRLFDIQVREVLIPSRVESAGREAKWLSRFRSEMGDHVTKLLEGQPEKPKMQEGDVALLRESHRQIIARDMGIVLKLYSREGTLQQLGEPMALLTTDDRGLIEWADDEAPPQAPAFRTAARSLDLDGMLNLLTEQVKPDSESARHYSADDHTIFWSEEGQEHRVGIVTKGSCDLRAVFASRPFIEKVLKGTCCIKHEGSVAGGRNDLLLQTLRDDLPREAIDEVISKLRLRDAWFEPGIFQKTFAAEGPAGLEEFPMSALILSNAPDLVRTLYRHRQHGFIADPGGWLDAPLEQALKDLSVITWFRRNFASIGRVSVEEYQENLSNVIKHVRHASGAQVVVFNQLTVDPNGLTHDYQFVKSPETTRRLEFKLALTEVSRKLNVPIIDADRIAKKFGIRTMRDINHFHPRVTLMIAEHLAGVLQDLGLFDGREHTL